MSTLLYLESSPRKTRSKSIAVASEFLDAYRTAHPDDQIDTWDLWNTPLPEFDGATIDAKYKTMHGESLSAEEAGAWEEVVRIFDRFNAADKYVLSVPMWNFGIPYKLKHFIDVIVQPGLAFRFSPESGYDRGSSPASRSSSFTPGGATIPPSKARRSISRNATWKTLLGFIGFTDVRSIIAQPTIGGPEQVAEVEEKAKAEAREMGAGF